MLHTINLKERESSTGWIQSWDEYFRLRDLCRDGITPFAFSDIKTGAYQLYDENGKLWKIPSKFLKPDSTLVSPILGKRFAERAYGVVSNPHTLDRDPSMFDGIDAMSFVQETPEDAMVAYVFSRHWVGRVI